MRKDFFNRMLASALLVAMILNFASCSSDDDNIPDVIPENLIEKVNGAYTGTMQTEKASTYEGEEEVPTGTPVTTKVNNDTVYFESIPIRDIVLGIIPDEDTADKIVETVGDVAYKIGYKATLNESKDCISLVMDPKPLTIDVAIPQEDGTPQNLHIEVNVMPADEATYVLEASELKFKITATEVNLGEGDDQTPIENFPQTVFNFTLEKNHPEQH